jgi:hypothetical protein
MKTKSDLTFAEIDQVLSYCPKSGIFKWKKHLGGRSPKCGEFAGTGHNAGYIQIGYKQKIYLAHRLAWLLTHQDRPFKRLDHINGNKKDNRICNLRECTHSQNLLNRSKQINNKTGYKNIFLEGRSKKYMVKINKNKKVYYVGKFAKLENAIKARDRAHKKICGEFSKI